MAQSVSTSAAKDTIIFIASNLSSSSSSQTSASEGALAIKSQSDTSSSTALATSTSNQDCEGDTLCSVSKESNESADTRSANILTRTHNISDDTATSAIIHTRTSTPVTISNEGAITMMAAILLFSVAIAIMINIDGLRSQAIQQRYEHIICSHHTMKNEQEHQLSSKLFICYKQQIEALKLAHQIRILGICRNFSKFRFRGSVGIRNVLGGYSNLSSTCSSFCLKFQTQLYEITLLLRLSTSLNTSINE